jgi:hypothetical protein
MANPDPHLLETSIRRIRSTGDIPRRPEAALIQPSTRPSESALDHQNQQIPSTISMELSSCNASSSRTHSTPSSVPAAPVSDLMSNNDPSAVSGTFYLPQRQTTQGTQTTNDHVPNHPPSLAPNTSLIGRLLTYFGLGRHASHARKALASLAWGILWDFSQVNIPQIMTMHTESISLQIVVIITLLILTGVHFRSKTDLNLSEWKACDRPLGVWASIWVIRVVLALILRLWEYQRNRILFVTLPKEFFLQDVNHLSTDILHP